MLYTYQHLSDGAYSDYLERELKIAINTPCNNRNTISVCSICVENDARILLCVCGHIVCEVCVTMIEICLLCRMYIKTVRHLM